MPFRPDLEGFQVRSTPRPYRVIWDGQTNPGLFLQRILDQNPRNLLLIDQKVSELNRAKFQVNAERVFQAQAKEEFKTMAGVTVVIEFLQKNGFSKGETLAVVGGGIIQDVGAFASACYKRGIPWVYFPTTLLSMCDSCIGGKAGINHGGA